LADELGIGTLHLVVNRTRSEQDLERVMDYIEVLGGPTFSSVTSVPYDEAALLCDPSVDALLGGSAIAEAVRALSTRVVGSTLTMAG
jgi:CO dehydrogenase nickel-insertion accessory protein CooC1